MEKQDPYKNRTLVDRDIASDCIDNLREAIRILEKIVTVEIKAKETGQSERKDGANEASP